MASLETNSDQDSGRKKRAKKNSTHIDMTPMVDLAFLLLTFFILTVNLQKTAALQLTYPVDSENDQPVNNAITVILTKNDRILYYLGEFTEKTRLQETDFKKIRGILMDLNAPAVQKIEQTKNEYAHLPENDPDSVLIKKINAIHKSKEALYCVIKADKFAKYRNMIDLVDELNVCEVGKYATSDAFNSKELELLKSWSEKIALKE